MVSTSPVSPKLFFSFTVLAKAQLSCTKDLNTTTEMTLEKKTRIHAYKKRSGKAHFQMLFWESPFPAAMFPRNWRLQRRAERNPENKLTRIQRNTYKFHKNYILQYSRYTVQNPSPRSFRCSISLLLYINICIFSFNANNFMKYFRITTKTCLSITHPLLVITKTRWQIPAPHIIFWLAGQITIDYWEGTQYLLSQNFYPRKMKASSPNSSASIFDNEFNMAHFCFYSKGLF